MVEKRCDFFYEGWDTNVWLLVAKENHQQAFPIDRLSITFFQCLNLFRHNIAKWQGVHTERFLR